MQSVEQGCALILNEQTLQLSQEVILDDKLFWKCHLKPRCCHDPQAKVDICGRGLVVKNGKENGNSDFGEDTECPDRLSCSGILESEARLGE